jgi:hypothetical protein
MEPNIHSNATVGFAECGELRTRAKPLASWARRMAPIRHHALVRGLRSCLLRIPVDSHYLIELRFAAGIAATLYQWFRHMPQATALHIQRSQDNKD